MISATEQRHSFVSAADIAKPGDVLYIPPAVTDNEAQTIVDKLAKHPVELHRLEDAYTQEQTRHTGVDVHARPPASPTATVAPQPSKPQDTH